MEENKRRNNIWMTKHFSLFSLFALGLLFGTGTSQDIYRNEEFEPLDYSNNFAVSSNQQPKPDYGYLDKLFEVEVPSKKDGVKGKEYFPLLMPKVKPSQEEAYLCTPIEIKDEEYYITGNVVSIIL